jgi:hypothetical protein
MSLGSLIRNVSEGVVTLPFPYSVMIPPGSAAVVTDPPNVLIPKLGGTDAIRDMLDIIDYDVTPAVLASTPHGSSDGLPTTNVSDAFLKRTPTNSAWEEVAFG